MEYGAALYELFAFVVESGGNGDFAVFSVSVLQTFDAY